MAGKQGEKKAGKPKSAGKRSFKIAHYYDNILPKRRLRRRLIHLLKYIGRDDAQSFAKANGWDAQRIFEDLSKQPRFEFLVARSEIRRKAATLRRNERRLTRKMVGGKKS